MNYTIDATNKSLGRLASEVAVLLMGKNDADFARNKVSANKVTVENASKLKIDPTKLETKTYKSFSGYPGGLKEISMQHRIEKKGYKSVVETAVKGMLPDNRLKKEMMKHLTITD
jgi:large subunit ribosomal protein L13